MERQGSSRLPGRTRRVTPLLRHPKGFSLLSCAFWGSGWLSHGASQRECLLGGPMAALGPEACRQVMYTEGCQLGTTHVHPQHGHTAGNPLRVSDPC